FDFLNPGLLGGAKDFARFIKNLQTGEHNAFAPLRTLVRPYILRRLKTDKRVISDLPDKTEVNAFCGLSKHQAALYEHTVRDLALTAAPHSPNAANTSNNSPATTAPHSSSSR